MKKKILGMPLALFVAGLLVIGGASALLVNYLSNQVTADAIVESPLELQISKDNTNWGTAVDLGTLKGGDTTTVYIWEKNYGSNPITTDILINVSEEGVDNSCAEITSMLYDDDGWTHELMDYCDDSTGDLIIAPFADQTLAAGHEKTYKIDIIFAQNAVGIYSATVRHMNP